MLGASEPGPTGYSALSVLPLKVVGVVRIYFEYFIWKVKKKKKEHFIVREQKYTYMTEKSGCT